MLFYDIIMICVHVQCCCKVKNADVSLKKDVKLVVKELVEKSKVFSNIPGRNHNSFKSLTGSLTEKLEPDKLIQWMTETVKRIHLS